MQNKLHHQRVTTGMVRLALIIVVVAFAFAPTARADGGDGGSDISLFVGSMLPNQIEGVPDILPVFGGRYGLGTHMGTFEFGLINTHAEGVDFTTGELSLRGDVPVGQGLSGLIYGGVDFNYYSKKGESNRQNETGFHVGLGGMMLVTDTLWLRSDLKFMGGPGTSLYLLFSIMFREGAGQ